MVTETVDDWMVHLLLEIVCLGKFSTDEWKNLYSFAFRIVSLLLSNCVKWSEWVGVRVQSVKWWFDPLLVQIIQSIAGWVDWCDSSKVLMHVLSYCYVCIM